MRKSKWPDDKAKDIRWQQRFSNYQKALAQLRKFISQGALSEFVALENRLKHLKNEN